MTEPTDGQLIERVQKGDKEAFGAVVERYKKRAYYAARNITGDHNEAMDLSQEAFVRAFRGIAKFDTSMDFFPWYYRTLRNLWINRGRKASKAHFVSLSPREDEDAPQLEIASSTDRPDVAAEKKELVAVLSREMGELDPDKREILHLRHVSNLSYKDIAKVLDIPEGTVMSRLFSARAALRERMGRYL
jgi:RNA polymerase sigma-70 factor, ECF subfamily